MSHTRFRPWPAELAQRYRQQGHWQGQSFPAFLHSLALAHGDKVAVSDGHRRWTYIQLERQALQAARWLRSHGLRQGDIAVLQQDNHVGFAALLFGLWQLGAVPVMALPAHRHREISAFCAHTQARAYLGQSVLQGADMREMARRLRAEHPGMLIALSGQAEPFVALDPALAEAHEDAQAASARAAQGAEAWPRVQAGDLALLQLSGGSTGVPKLIPRTADDYLYSVRESARICGLGPQTVALGVLPAAHNFALSSPGLLGVLHAGGHMVMAPSGDPGTAFARVQAEGVNWCALVPSLVPVWLQAARDPAMAAQLETLAVVQVGGAKLDADMAARLESGLGVSVQQVFGMAEGLVCYTRWDDSPALRLGTQGRPISPDDEVLVVDEHDRPVPDGETGHLLTRGPYTLRAYYAAPGLQAQCFTADGFYRTGDLVRRLPSGHLIVEGRHKDVINRGGEKIGAAEIEGLLMAHPAVHEAALVGMPDALLGERSWAVVVPRDPALRPPELLRHLRGQGIATFKVPDRVVMTAALPHTAVGKVDKVALRQALAAGADPSLPAKAQAAARAHFAAEPEPASPGLRSEALSPP